MHFKALKDMMLFLVQGHILLKIPALRFAAVACRLQASLGFRGHVINVVRSQEMVVDAQVSLPGITGTSSGFGVRPCLVVLENIGYLVPCHGTISHVGVDERPICLQLGDGPNSSRLQDGRASYNFLIQRRIIRSRI